MDDDLLDGEALTGVELHHYLLETNRAQRTRAEDMSTAYDTLRGTLRSLTDRSRRRVLAPVAGGLGYFAAELTSTNNLLVLLGEGWFAERSARQAIEVVDRRLDFLHRERRVLEAERVRLAQQEELFRREVPGADGPRREAPESTSTPPPLPADAAVFDALDELTEEELIAIEHELGDRVDDDELVERVLTERLIAKKERRARAEAAASPIVPDSSVFRSPADIGPARTTTEAVPAVSRGRKAVHFEPEITVVSPTGETTRAHLPATAGASPGASATAEGPPAGPRRGATTYAMGDVVERPAVMDGTSSSRPDRPANPRRSLFLRTLTGN